MPLVSATTDVDLLDRLAVEIDLDAAPSDLDGVLAAFLILQLDDPLDPAAGPSFATTGDKEQTE